MKHPWLWTGIWTGRRPFIGTDEYWQHTITVMWPFSHRIHDDGTPLYRGLTLRLPTTCLEPLIEDLDRLRAEGDAA